jgi:hypothetical protein
MNFVERSDYQRSFVENNGGFEDEDFFKFGDLMVAHDR